MNKISIFFLIFFSITSLKAQTIFACQNFKAAGFDWKNDRWVNTNFLTSKPFFIKYINQDIDEESVWRMFSGDMKFYPDYVTCKKTSTQISSCMTMFGESLVFNPKISEGAISRIGGGADKNQKLNSRDSVAIELFSCQKM